MYQRCRDRWTVKGILRWVDRLFNRHKFVRRLLVLWAASLITWVIFRVFTDLTLITTPVVSAMSIVVGLLATAIGFYNYQRRMDEREQDDVDSSTDGG